VIEIEVDLNADDVEVAIPEGLAHHRRQIPVVQNQLQGKQRGHEGSERGDTPAKAGLEMNMHTLLPTPTASRSSISAAAAQGPFSFWKKVLILSMRIEPCVWVMPASGRMQISKQVQDCSCNRALSRGRTHLPVEFEQDDAALDRDLFSLVDARTQNEVGLAVVQLGGDHEQHRLLLLELVEATDDLRSKRKSSTQ
jgi:hypothetical protein